MQTLPCFSTMHCFSGISLYETAWWALETQSRLEILDWHGLYNKMITTGFNEKVRSYSYRLVWLQENQNKIKGASNVTSYMWIGTSNNEIPQCTRIQRQRNTTWLQQHCTVLSNTRDGPNHTLESHILVFSFVSQWLKATGHSLTEQFGD